MATPETLKLRTGDHVHHAPSGEDWVVAWADNEWMSWCGWPPEGRAKVADCTLIKACTDAEHVKLLEDLAAGVGSAAVKAKATLANAEPHP